MNHEFYPIIERTYTEVEKSQGTITDHYTKDKRAVTLKIRTAKEMPEEFYTDLMKLVTIHSK